MINNKSSLSYYIKISILIILDQLSKKYIITYFKTNQTCVLNICPVLDFVYIWNHGISFALFNKYFKYSNIIFLSINSIITTYFILQLTISNSSTNNINIYGLILIIAGGLSNMVDRICYGAIFDFIHCYYKKFNFLTFNLGDIFIIIGSILHIYNYQRHSKPTPIKNNYR
jgi:signal peptidase II